MIIRRLQTIGHSNFGRIFDTKNSMKQILLFLFFIGFMSSGTLYSQELKLRKGVIIDSLPVNDSIPESFALYLPTKFDTVGKWPVIFVFDMQGRGKQALRTMKAAAEEQGYLLAASNNVHDSLSIANNILIANRVFNTVYRLFPIHKNRVYTAGFANGAKFATTIPTFIKQITGVLSLGSGIPNLDILNSRNTFQFVGVVGNEDFNYTGMLQSEKILDQLGFPNQLIVFDGGHRWPDPEYIDTAMEILTLSAIANGAAKKDSTFVMTGYRRNLGEVSNLMATNKMTKAYDLLEETAENYKEHLNVDSLKTWKRELKKHRDYRTQKRNRANLLFQESLMKEDYKFNLLEDIETLNYNNLGWWNYQMGELKKYEEKPSPAERQMGMRLQGYLNALIEDNIDIELSETPVNVEAVNFLWMLKTITDPMDYSYYLKIISGSALYEDYGTALFYLEELLKNGYKDKSELYSLEHTALLRITPEFNKIVDKYLEDARYDLIEE